MPTEVFKRDVTADFEIRRKNTSFYGTGKNLPLTVDEGEVATRIKQISSSESIVEVLFHMQVRRSKKKLNAKSFSISQAGGDIVNPSNVNISNKEMKIMERMLLQNNHDEGERAKRASLDENDDTRDGSSEMAADGYIHYLTHSIRLTRFIRFTLASLKMRLASLGAVRTLSKLQNCFQNWRKLDELLDVDGRVFGRVLMQKTGVRIFSQQVREVMEGMEGPRRRQTLN